MKLDAECPTKLETNGAIERIFRRAFLTAQLLTGSMEQAERAVVEAIGSWNPGEESEEILFVNVLNAALRTQSVHGESSSNKPDAGSQLPVELRAVLRLAPELRRCYVLRLLVGLSPQDCGRLLRLHSRRVDRYTCAALECLGKLSWHPTAHMPHRVEQRESLNA